MIKNSLKSKNQKIQKLKRHWSNQWRTSKDKLNRISKRLNRIEKSQLNNSFLNKKVLEKLWTKEERGMNKGNRKKSRIS